MASKILFVVNNYSFFISHRLDIGKAALSSGYRVMIAGPRDLEPMIQLESFGFELSPIDVKQQDHGVISQLKFLCAVIGICRKFRPDIAHLITLKTFLVGGAAARLAKVPWRVGSVSGLGYFFISQSLTAKLARLMYRPLFNFSMAETKNRVIFQNDDDCKLMRHYARIKANQSLMVPGSGVDLKRFKVELEPEGAIRFVLIGRMLKDKGVMEFVEAAKALRTQGINANFVLAGLPDFTNPASISEDLLMNWNNGGVVRWVGFVDDVATLIADSHVVVLPSYREGFPKVLIEAAACGRAAITTDVPGCRHAVKDGETGILVPVKDSDILSKAMLYLVEHPIERKAMGEKARALAIQDYSVENIVQSHMYLYEQLIGAR